MSPEEDLKSFINQLDTYEKRQQFQELLADFQKSRIIRFDRAVLHFLSKFCRVDKLLLASRRFNDLGDEPAKQTQTRRTPCWSKMLVLFYCYSAIKLSVYLYFQYLHDYYLFKYNRANSSAESVHQLHQQQLPSSSINLVDKTRSNMLEQVEFARVRLKQIGAPYISASWAIQVAYITIIMILFPTYFQGPNLLQHSGMHFRFARLILDPESERRDCIRTTSIEASRFVASSRNFTRESRRVTGELQQSGLLELANQSRQFKFNYEIVLKQLAFDGLLQTMCWYPKWIFKVSVAFGIFSLMTIVYSLIISASVAILLPIVARVNLETDPLDLLMMFENLFLNAIMAVVITLYVSIIVFSSLDQLKNMAELRKQLSNCTKSNRAMFIKLTRTFSLRTPRTRRLAPSSIMLKAREKMHSPFLTEPFNNNRDKMSDFLIDSHSKQMNMNLLIVFINYKTFVRRSAPVQKSNRVLVMITLVLLFVLPIVSRLHVPYAQPNLRILATIICLTIVFIADFCLVPVCYIHSRSLDLYRSLWSLLAHTIELERWIYENSHKHSYYDSRTTIYDRHLVWSLRKQLNHPDRLIKQFATTAFGLELSYPNLIRIHFWFGLVALSIITDAGSNQLLIFGSFLTDPLGLF